MLGSCYGSPMSFTQESAATIAWQQLCESLSSDPGLWAEVRLAHEQPSGYLDRFRVRLGHRGITTIDGVSPWIALVDWLDEHYRLVELDGTNSSHDLADDLSTLPLLDGVDLRPIAAESVPLGFAVPRANTVLARNFYTLLYLDIDSDAYPLALVSTEASARVQEIAARLGRVARPFDDRETADSVAAGARGYRFALPAVVAAPSGPRPVNFGKRLLALVVDAVLLYGVLAGGVSLGILVNGSPRGDGVIPGVLFAVLGLYLVGLVILVGRTGRSIGMLLLGLKLVRVESGSIENGSIENGSLESGSIENGRAPGYVSAAGRGALVVLLVFWVWALVALITTLIDPNGRGLVDKAAGTIMIDTRRRSAIPATV